MAPDFRGSLIFLIEKLTLGVALPFPINDLTPVIFGAYHAGTFLSY